MGSRATDEKGGKQMISRWMRDDVLSRVQELKSIASELQLSMAQLAVAWVLQNDNVASAITGGSRPEQVHDNVAAAGHKLSAETIAGIDKALGDVVESDGSIVGAASPKSRLT